MAWQLYDDLIARIPGGITVTDVISSHWTAVRTDDGHAGIAMTYSGGPREAIDRVDLVGMPLRDVAALVKSWNLPLAAIGTAALNAWFNRAEHLFGHEVLGGGDQSTFALHAPQMAGKRIAAIGHFSDIVTYSKDHDFIVLERLPRGDDLPDSACEYVLADGDLVYITGSTLTNKTLPRLLALSAHARVVLVGASSPFGPDVFGSQVAEIGGAIVTDPDRCLAVISAGGSNSEFRPYLRQFNVSFDQATSASQ